MLGPDSVRTGMDYRVGLADQTPFGIRFRFPIQSCGLPVRQDLACFGPGRAGGCPPALPQTRTCSH
jgi:hypothetical protein